MKVSSSTEGELIDGRFTYDGSGISPPISWTDPPAGTRSFAIIMDVPDAPLGTFVHRVIYNIGPDFREIPENFQNVQQEQRKSTQGRGGLGKIGYQGPCPPGRNTHGYVFHLYATTVDPDLPPGIKKKQLLRAIEGRILEETSFTLRYARTKDRANTLFARSYLFPDLHSIVLSGSVVLREIQRTQYFQTPMTRPKKKNIIPSENARAASWKLFM